MDTSTSSDRPRTALTTADLAAIADRGERPASVEDGEPSSVTANPREPQRDELAPLFEHGAAQEFRQRWSVVQQGFVDDPQQAVREGDELVAQVIKSLADTFAKQRTMLEDNQGSTEELRLALRRYRSFFERLLAI